MEPSKEKAKLVERLRNPRFRPREGRFLAEGVRVVREVLGASLKLEVSFAVISPRLSRSDPEGIVRKLLEERAIPTYQVSDPALSLHSDTQTHQGVLMVVREPMEVPDFLEAGGQARVLLLDRIQDPGNAGNLIRAARAFGLTGVLSLDGTVDVWNPKVVRASAGALAHVPVTRLPWSEAEARVGGRSLALLAADAGGDPLGSYQPVTSWALAVGNEGAGVRKEILEKASKVLAVPMAGGADSLNAGAAGAILMYALCSPAPGEAAAEDGRERKD